MSSPDIQTTATSPLWLYLWHRPTITVARFILWSYIRSGWIVGDILFIGLLYALFFSTAGGDVTYFYGSVGPGLCVLAVLDTIVMVQRSLRSARLYLPLSRLTTRSSYVRGLLLASATLRLPLFLLMLLLAGPKIAITASSWEHLLLGAIGLLLICLTFSTLTVVLSLPIATRRIQIVFLIWLTLMLYSHTISGTTIKILLITQIPLAPIAGCYSLGQMGVFGVYELGMVLLILGYIILLAYFAEFLLARRDLILH